MVAAELLAVSRLDSCAKTGPTCILALQVYAREGNLPDALALPAAYAARHGGGGDEGDSGCKGGRRTPGDAS
jgi:hypothetical protein